MIFAQFYRSLPTSSKTKPDAEVFYVREAGGINGKRIEPGFYWWPCGPDRLPSAKPVGPFETAAKAIEDAQRAP